MFISYMNTALICSSCSTFHHALYISINNSCFCPRITLACLNNHTKAPEETLNSVVMFNRSLLPVIDVIRHLRFTILLYIIVIDTVFDMRKNFGTIPNPKQTIRNSLGFSKQFTLIPQLNFERLEKYVGNSFAFLGRIFKLRLGNRHIQNIKS